MQSKEGGDEGGDKEDEEMNEGDENEYLEY